MAHGQRRQEGRGKGQIDLTNLIDLFIASKEVEGRSKKTTDWYRANLKVFAAFMGKQGPVTVQDLTVSNARAFVAELQSRTTRYSNHSSRPAKTGGLSAFTINGYIRTVKAFGAWLHEEGFASQHPFERLKAPKLPDTVIEILSEEEIQRLFNATNPNTALGARNQLILLLLLDTGIRASELCGLKVEHTYLNESYIKVRGKGNKERIVPFGATTKKAIMRYLNAYRSEPASDDVRTLILTMDGFSLEYEGLAQIIRRMAVGTDIPRLHIHLFRHTFAVRYLMNGGDVMTLRLILGHTTLDVTQMYMHLADAHIQVQHSKFSPVDRLELSGRKRRGHSS